MARGPEIAVPVTDSSRFLIHGVEVRVYCDHEPAHERIAHHLEPYLAPSSPPPSAPGLELEIRKGEVIYPAPLHSRLLLHYGRLRSYFIDGRHYFTDYFSTLTVEPDGRRVHGNLSEITEKENGLHFFVDMLFHLALFEALRFHGLYYLHAAALEGPDGVGYLVSGNAGSGKTSLTISLIHAGFKFLSDDTVFLRLSDGDGVEVLGFSRDFHVALDLIRTSRALSRLEGLPDYTPYRAKKRLRADEWFPGKRRDRILNPGVIIFSQIGSGPSQLAPLSSGEALPRLLPQSLSVVFSPQAARPHLEALKRLLLHSRAFSLMLGDEVKGDPELTRRLFEAARDFHNPGAKK